jgi:putative ABC transport system permease protein
MSTLLDRIGQGFGTHWREAVEELWRRRLRTLLTLLGLIFGVGSIVAMQGVGEGSRQEALKLVEGLGLRNLIAKTESPPDEDALREMRARSLGLTRADADAALDVVPGATGIAAEKAIKTHSVLSEFSKSDAVASGVTPGYFALSSLQVAQGRAFDDSDDDRLAAVAVLGHQAAKTLFPGRSAVGELVKVNHAWFEVIGVLTDRDLSKDQFEGVHSASRAIVSSCRWGRRWRVCASSRWRMRSTVSWCSSTIPRISSTARRCCRQCSTSAMPDRRTTR